MLRSLHIENIAVISSIDIDFEFGFSVLTGETGAGKSIIIDSINMLLGNKMPKDLIRNGETRALVSGVFEGLNKQSVDEIKELGFDIDDNSVMLQRTLSRDGRSSAKVNGQTVTQSLMREISQLLINIHGQNDNQRLLQKAHHTEILDSYAGCGDILSEYSEVYSALSSASKELEKLNVDEAGRLRRIEMLRFWISDIKSVAPRVGEEERLEAEKKKLLSLEKIKKQTAFSYKVLYGNEKGASVHYMLERVAQSLLSVSDAVPEFEELSERVNEMKYEIADIAESVRAYEDDSDADPTERINKIEARLDAILKLKKKYGSTVEDVLSFAKRSSQELSELENSDEKTEQLEKHISELRTKAEETADRLHKARTLAALELERRIMDELEFLDMSKVRFKADVKRTGELTKSGADDIEFLIATNKGDKLMPLISIASGGELSRITLAIKSVLADKDGVDTLIFDEIDTGISGKTSRKVGIKLKETAGHVQVICITHSAQIASLANTHYLISKSDNESATETSVRVLDNNGRIEEIARILGGINITDAQRMAASEMIAEGERC